jgi:hypothetical protein
LRRLRDGLPAKSDKNGEEQSLGDKSIKISMETNSQLGNSEKTNKEAISGNSEVIQDKSGSATKKADSIGQKAPLSVVIISLVTLFAGLITFLFSLLLIYQNVSEGNEILIYPAHILVFFVIFSIFLVTAAYGLRTMKKWGLYAFASWQFFAILYSIFNIFYLHFVQLSTGVVGILFNGLIVYYLYKIRDKFEPGGSYRKVEIIGILCISLSVMALAGVAAQEFEKFEKEKVAALVNKANDSLKKAAEEQKNIDKPSNLDIPDRKDDIVAGEMFEDRSPKYPIDTNIDLNPEDSLAPIETLKLLYTSATKGVSAQQASQCQNVELQKTDLSLDRRGLQMDVCIGGFAAVQDDQSLCENYDFKSKYYYLSMCDDNCGETRHFKDGNSAFEACYIGYGVIKKDEQSCLGLPDVSDQKNVPIFSDDKTAPLEMKKESCIYGAAIGKNNYSLCAKAGFFKDSCYYNFAVYRKSADLCDNISSDEMKNRCIMSLARLSSIVDKCSELKPLKSSNGPVFYSNMPKAPSEETNKDTEDKDDCIYTVVNTQKLLDKSICEKIVSPRYKFLCRQSVAINLKDPTLCSLDYLGSQGNVDGCIYDLSKELKDITLCQKSSDYDRCQKLYNGENVPATFGP